MPRNLAADATWQKAIPIGSLPTLASNTDHDPEIARLAKLDVVAYERERISAAERLGVRISVLDKLVNAERAISAPSPGQGNALDLPSPKPWDDPVNGEVLLTDLTAGIRRYVVMEDGAAESMALWAIHAHALDAFGISPRLAITSPEKGCGKTTALDVMGRLVPRSLPTANITAASIFRTIEMAGPTLLIDEADTFLKDNDEMRGVLNSGHRRSTANIIRTVGEDHEPRQFSTWAATAIAMIGRLPDTLEDRSIPIRLRRRLPSETIESLRWDRMNELDLLARKAARWAADNIDALRRIDPVMPAGLINRAADNWRPLLAIADIAGGSWPQHARKIMLAVAGPNSNEQSIRVMLLEDIQATFEEKCTDRLSSAELVAALTEMEGRPWPEWRGGKPLTQSGLAKQLGHFGIAPANLRTGETVVRGYRKEQFGDAFARYIPGPSVEGATPLQTAISCGFLAESQPLQDDGCSGSENAGSPQNYRECSGVAAEKLWEADI